MKWSSPGPWTNTIYNKAGYEHDLWVQDPNFFTTTCTSMTNLPDAYDDCPTAGVADPNGPVFSFGSFDATKITANTEYFGAWTFTNHGTASTSPFKLQGQENENVCWGYENIWCRYALRTKDLITGWYMYWTGTPTTIPY